MKIDDLVNTWLLFTMSGNGHFHHAIECGRHTWAGGCKLWQGSLLFDQRTQLMLIMKKMYIVELMSALVAFLNLALTIVLGDCACRMVLKSRMIGSRHKLSWRHPAVLILQPSTGRRRLLAHRRLCSWDPWELLMGRSKRCSFVGRDFYPFYNKPIAMPLLLLLPAFDSRVSAGIKSNRVR